MRGVHSAHTEVAVPLVVVRRLLVVEAERGRESTGHPQIDGRVYPPADAVAGVAAVLPEEHVRGPGLSRVELDATPEVVVARASYRRPAARFTVGVGRLEIPEVAADVAPPLVGELHVPVPVERH